MKRVRGRGGRFAVVEWASWSLANGFLSAWPANIGVVTNVTGDHLDYHGSFEAYLDSKARLVRSIRSDGFVVLNDDDEHARSLEADVDRGTRVLRYGGPGRETRSLDVEIVDAEVSWTGTAVRYRFRDGTTATSHLPMIGAHFAENAAAALACAQGLGVDPRRAAAALEGVEPPAGRFEVVRRDPHVVIDFAHTVNGLRRTLETAKALCRGQLSVVVGAGGERDATKRAPLGRAAEIADRIVLTSDNPRRESPMGIIREIRAGTSEGANVRVEPDRAAAIACAVGDAGPSDVVVIAGRGRDTHQLVGEQWRPMDDAALAAAAHDQPA